MREDQLRSPVNHNQRHPLCPSPRQGRPTKFDDDREASFEDLMHEDGNAEVRFPQLTIPGADVHPDPRGGPEPRDEYEIRPGQPGERY
jgi:hypothetical protein